MPHYYTYDSNLRDRNKYTSTVQTTFGTRRYFSSLDTEVYFGQTQIDEIVAIDFVIAEPKLPIYGYNSFYANRIISGRRTVQGTFAINFTNTKYLLKILIVLFKLIFSPVGVSKPLSLFTPLHSIISDKSYCSGTSAKTISPVASAKYFCA